MAKRKSPQARSSGKSKSVEPLRTALKKRTKDELIDLVLEWVATSQTKRRELESRYDVKLPTRELVAQTRQAIADATDFDERQINYNFDYDYAAYEAVARNFERLIKFGQLAQAMDLSLELMRCGSHQVEMSDEGLMTEDIEACLQVVLRAVGRSAMSPAQVAAWCDTLRKSDRVGFILDKELMALRNRFSER